MEHTDLGRHDMPRFLTWDTISGGGFIGKVGPHNSEDIRVTALNEESSPSEIAQPIFHKESNGALAATMMKSKGA